MSGRDALSGPLRPQLNRPPLIVPFGDPITTPKPGHLRLSGPQATIASLSLSSIRLV